MALAIRIRHTDQQMTGSTPDDLLFHGTPAALVLAYISSRVDFNDTIMRLQALCGTIPLIAVSTAGGLYAPQQGDALYISTATQPDSVVLQIFPPDLFQEMQIISVSLHNHDIRNGSFTMNASTRIASIARELEHIEPAFIIDARDTVALTFIDGLSCCESYFMEAIYASNKFPCMFVGGSSASKLDFKHSYIYNGSRILENHAVVILLKLAHGRSYSVLKTQNFKEEDISFEVAEADTDRRTIYAIYDSETGAKHPAAHYIAKVLGVSVAGLADYFKRKTFGIRIGRAYYCRSISGINPATGAITFYCDVNPGDHLFLSQAVDLEAYTQSEVEAFLSSRPPALGAILNDCSLRRVNNDLDQQPLNSCWPLPVAGFSTFGEIFGINVNQTLSALVFFDSSGDPYWVDPFVQEFPLYYASYSGYFALRREQARSNLALVQTRQTQDQGVSQSMHFGVVTIDSSGTMLMVNKAMESIFGYTTEELLGRNVSMLMPDPDRSAHNGYLQRYIDTGERRIAETGRDVIALRKNGDQFNMNLSVTRLVQEGQMRFVGICRDISAQKKREDVLLAEKTQALDESRSKAAFLAHMSHELRTPLNGLLGMLQLLVQTPLSQEQHELVNHACVSGDALLEIVNDVLDISKIEAEGLKLETVGFDLLQTVSDALSMVHLLAHKKKLPLNHTLPATLPYVVGDPLRLRQVMVNLLGNAIKYTTQGAVSLSVQILKQDLEQISLRLEVRDTGIGIPADKLDSIFESFNQADISTTRHFGGTGLGLTISKKLIQLMGGHIGVTSVVDEGSLFWCELSLPITDSIYEARFHQTDSEKMKGSLKPSAVRILVAEDMPMNVLLVKKALQKLGITQATYVTNGKQALDAFEPGKWDMILMDCFMPEMTGYEASQAIRQLEAKGISHVPIIAMTANAMAGDREECLRHGMDYYLAKPLKLDLFKAALTQWIDFSDADV